MPSKLLSTLAAPKNHDIKSFRLGHSNLSSADIRQSARDDSVLLLLPEQDDRSSTRAAPFQKHVATSRVRSWLYRRAMCRAMSRSATLFRSSPTICG
jgi:hypothetical protein